MPAEIFWLYWNWKQFPHVAWYHLSLRWKIPTHNLRSFWISLNYIPYVFISFGLLSIFKHSGWDFSVEFVLNYENHSSSMSPSDQVNFISINLWSLFSSIIISNDKLYNLATGRHMSSICGCYQRCCWKFHKGWEDIVYIQCGEYLKVAYQGLQMNNWKCLIALNHGFPLIRNSPFYFDFIICCPGEVPQQCMHCHIWL